MEKHKQIHLDEKENKKKHTEENFHKSDNYFNPEKHSVNEHEI